MNINIICDSCNKSEVCKYYDTVKKVASTIESIDFLTIPMEEMLSVAISCSKSDICYPKHPTVGKRLLLEDNPL